MKTYKNLSVLSLSFLMLFAFPVFTSANSSWVWISESRPYDVLPFVAVGTILLETLAINLFGSVSNRWKTLAVVTAGNLLSFLLPYVYINYFTAPYSGVYNILEIIERGPFYTVGAVFLLLTLIIEMPVVYLFLRKDAENRKKLILSVLLSNIITTALVALTERLICYGSW